MAQDTPTKLAALLQAAWQLQPAARPSAAQLEADLQQLLAEMEAAPRPTAGPTLQNGYTLHHSPCLSTAARGVIVCLLHCIVHMPVLLCRQVPHTPETHVMLMLKLPAQFPPGITPGMFCAGCAESAEHNRMSAEADATPRQTDELARNGDVIVEAEWGEPGWSEPQSAVFLPTARHCSSLSGCSVVKFHCAWHTVFLFLWNG
jgi:hypothetical protein